ncbi:alpha/beta fold hydrolase [Mucilaginibacter polytrichastri]|nr:alpha/beta hydrolase [Mucilaginibacter polytrichastri]
MTLFSFSKVQSQVVSDKATYTDTSYTTGSVISKDGTKIGYRQYGHGTPLVIVQGAMGVAYNYDQLAKALAAGFTVYVPDRRGRGLSTLEYTPQYTIQRDVEDLQSILEKTQAHLVFALSSGAIITLEACKVLPAIQKVVLYEPPFYVKGVPTKNIDRLNQEVAEGKLASAMVTIFRTIKVGPPVFAYIPRPVLTFLVKRPLELEQKNGPGKYEYYSKLIPSIRYDAKIVLERGGEIKTYHSVNQPILLLGGTKSPKYLQLSLDSLQKILPNGSRKIFKGLDHSGPWNKDKGGSPELVANAIIEYFKKLN